MKIGSISSIASTYSGLAALSPSKPVAPDSSAATSTTAAKASFSAASTASRAVAKAPASSATQGGDVNDSAQPVTDTTAYSTTVAGKLYNGSVAESGGVYTASIPHLPAISSTGSSRQAAEDNLNSRISLLA